MHAASGDAADKGSGSPMHAASGDAADKGSSASMDAASGDAAYRGSGEPARGASSHQFTRIARSWRWQTGFHDHKFRTRESEARKWEYVCLNPVRYHLVSRPEEWPYGGEIFYEYPGAPQLVRGTPPLLETGILIEEDGTMRPQNRRVRARGLQGKGASWCRPRVRALVRSGLCCLCRLMPDFTDLACKPFRRRST
jgi:hypothetical protein